MKHPKDIEEFKVHPAPIMELIHSGHFININATITYFGPMLYFLTRALLCQKVLEIGHAEGYTSWYLANAVKDNALRHNYKNHRYCGIDIVKTKEVSEMLSGLNVPFTLLKTDTINLHSGTFLDIKFDLIFQDGPHDAEHVLHEMKVLYPQLKGNGLGYWIFHDCFGPAEEGFNEIKKLIKEGVYNFEYTCLDDNIYGLAILRKMEGYRERKHWKN